LEHSVTVLVAVCRGRVKALVAVSASLERSFLSARTDFFDICAIARALRSGLSVALACRMARGFSLVEVLVASSVVTVAIVGVMPLAILSTRAAESAKGATFAAVLAQQKMEQLRALAWTVGVDGRAVSDTTTDVASEPERPGGGTGLSPSPARGLDRDTPGYCDAVDAAGYVLAAGSPAVAFTRRWSIDPWPADPANTLVLQVRVVRSGAMSRPGRMPDEARLTTVKARRVQ
jgi:prepilin-type N-terminal cleavage/methylation domain-containing protein